MILIHFAEHELGLAVPEDVVVRANHNQEWSDINLEERDWLLTATVVVIEPITIRLNLPPRYISKTIPLTLEFYLINK